MQTVTSLKTYPLRHKAQESSPPESLEVEVKVEDSGDDVSDEEVKVDDGEEPQLEDKTAKSSRKHVLDKTVIKCDGGQEPKRNKCTSESPTQIGSQMSKLPILNITENRNNSNKKAKKGKNDVSVTSGAVSEGDEDTPDNTVDVKIEADVTNKTNKKSKKGKASVESGRKVSVTSHAQKGSSPAGEPVGESVTSRKKGMGKTSAEINDNASVSSEKDITVVAVVSGKKGPQSRKQAAGGKSRNVPPSKIAKNEVENQGVPQKQSSRMETISNDSKENKGIGVGVGRQKGGSVRNVRVNARSAWQTQPLSVTNNKQAELTEPESSDSDEAIEAEEAEFKARQQTKSQASKSKSKAKSSDKQKQKDASRQSWFDPSKYDTKWVRHPKKEKKELPADADIYCMKCNSVFDSTQELSDHEKNCYTGRRYPCTWPEGCPHVNSQ